jgi:hypothetical protein
MAGKIIKTANTKQDLAKLDIISTLLFVQIDLLRVTANPFSDENIYLSTWGLIRQLEIKFAATISGGILLPWKALIVSGAGGRPLRFFR